MAEKGAALAAEALADEALPVEALPMTLSEAEEEAEVEAEAEHRAAAAHQVRDLRGCGRNSIPWE